MDCYQKATIRAMRTSGRDRITPLYSHFSNIAAGKGGHIEVVAPGINSCFNSPRSGFDD